jgi:hypothetical protein
MIATSTGALRSTTSQDNNLSEFQMMATSEVPAHTISYSTCNIEYLLRYYAGLSLLLYFTTSTTGRETSAQIVAQPTGSTPVHGL